MARKSQQFDRYWAIILATILSAQFATLLRAEEYPSVKPATITNRPAPVAPSRQSVVNPFSRETTATTPLERPQRGPLSRWEKLVPGLDLAIQPDLFRANIPSLESPNQPLAPPSISPRSDLATTVEPGAVEPESITSIAADTPAPPGSTNWDGVRLRQPEWLEPIDTSFTFLPPRQLKKFSGAEERLQTSLNQPATQPRSRGRWHAADEEPFDPFEKPTIDKPFNTGELTGEIECPPRLAAIAPEGEMPARSENRIAHPLDELWQLAEVARSVDDLSEVIRRCHQELVTQSKTESAVALCQLTSWSYNARGEEFSKSGAHQKALDDFQTALELDEKNWRAVHNRAVSLVDQQRYGPALRDFTRTIELNPALKVAYRNRGELLAALDRSAEAINDYTAALSGLPPDAELYALRAYARHRLRNYQQAVNDFDESLRISPHNPNALTGRGNLHAEIGRYVEAIKDFQLAVQADSGWGDAYRSLAWLLATCPAERFRDPQQAMVAARKASECGQPSDPLVLDTLAAAAASGQQYRAAVEFEQRAIMVAPSELLPIFQHRLALYEQGKPFVSGRSGGVQATSYQR